MLNLEQTCNFHSIIPRLTLMRSGLSLWIASLSVVKELLFRVHRNALLGRIAATPSSGLVWWDLLVRVARTRLPALLTSACAEFLPRVLVALRLASEIPCGTSSHSSLATNHCRKIKNPASSAGYSHPHLSGSTRCSTSF
jgi:hypothetical protein